MIPLLLERWFYLNVRMCMKYAGDLKSPFNLFIPSCILNCFSFNPAYISIGHVIYTPNLSSVIKTSKLTIHSLRRCKGIKRPNKDVEKIKMLSHLV